MWMAVLETAAMATDFEVVRLEATEVGEADGRLVGRMAPTGQIVV